ncbi:CPBP family intramembrane glutamic endopeptidase [Roseivirga sp. E12]|uniref:CPBP family intramembrane glutamic endopeptidase n=1 Tax=Roseivirga sp. E12 TaxID=2819237 RepID=UPI001ABCC38A|nr:type II CAAX endopeptidase family protein [Roseivirga sp. E12]MBO3697579.1 CPBP family intramembrane metalloprotease [Roseivirga sp. E12]
MKKIIDYWISRIVLGIIACVLGTFVIKEFVTQPLLQLMLDSEELRNGIQQLLSGVLIIAIYYFVYKGLEKRKLQELGLDTFGKDMSLGLLIGFGLISLCMLILYGLGYYQINGMNSPSVILLPFTLLVSAALLEEFVFRGVIYRILEERFGTNIALFQALIFGVVHYANVNATVSSVGFVILFGVVLSLMYTYTQKLWLPFSFHLGWNFAQTVYGTTLSGDTSFDAFLYTEFNGSAFFIGSEFGIEDSFFSFLFISILAIYLYWVCKKNGKLKFPNTKLHPHTSN